MKVAKLRHLMEQYGKVGRIYCQLEDKTVKKRRVKLGGNRKSNFTEGWVEFNDKRVAKKVAATLNGSQVGGNRRNFHFEDLWNMKYLSKFKWEHLTEEINYRNKTREQRMRESITQRKKADNFYVSRVEKALIEEQRLNKNKKRKATEADEAASPRPTAAVSKTQPPSGAVEASDNAAQSAQPTKIRRSFLQKSVVRRDNAVAGAATSSLLSKLFG
jgi:ESF2/ABP1 family protein